ncbi:hypothetical protein DIPPA_60345, partial [Diplonema papillatum]
MANLDEIESVFPDESTTTLHQLGSRLLAFLEKYQALYTHRFTEFLTKGCAADVPETWMDYLSHVEEVQLRGIAGGVVPDSHCPSDLAAFINCCTQFKLRRTQNAIVDGRHNVKCEGVLKRNMSVKKRYEVECMTGLVDAVARAPVLTTGPNPIPSEDALAAPTAFTTADVSGDIHSAAVPSDERLRPHATTSECIIDVGSGQGYLPTLMSYGLQRRVIAIEAAKQNVERAIERGKVISKCKALASKCDEDGNAGLVSYVPAYISPDTTDGDLSRLLESCGVPKVAQNRGLCLTGLHACGDLTPHLLRLFTSCSTVTSIAVVGCCYYKMGWPEPHNYPMSTYLRESKMKAMLGPTAAQIACETSFKWYTAPDPEFEHTKDLSLKRCLLETVLHTCYPDCKETIGVTMSRNAAKEKFPEYAQHCLQRVKMRRMDLTVLSAPADAGGHVAATAENAPTPSQPHPSREELEALYTTHLPRMRQLVVWLTLRECVAPVLETLFVLDRFLALKEALGPEGGLARAIPIFDHERSPRNVALV